MLSYDALVKDAGLNRSQKKFCKTPIKANVRLLAPAGSGKTYSLLWRCKYIVEQSKEKDLPAPYFLLVAFTRAAKLEIESRLKHEPAFSDIRATVRTLNAWGWEQIRKPGKELLTKRIQRQNAVNHDLLPLIQKHSMIANGFKTAYSRASNSALLMDLIDLWKSLGFTHTMNKTAYNSHVRHLTEIGLRPILDDAYELLNRMEGIRSEDKKAKASGISEFFEFWKKAVIQLEANNRYTMEDQKYWARITLESQIDSAKSPQGITRYTHIMVDEFQDINPLDLELLKAACRYHGKKGKPVSITLIGDDDQAIFGWRGTTPQYILYPEQFFGAKFTTCVLDTNYRSPKNIVEVSNKLLSYNKERVPKDIKSAAKGRAVIKIQKNKKVYSSIEATMKLIRSLQKDERFQEIALIGRRQVSLFPFQVLLSAEGLPYHVDTDIDIFQGEVMQSLQNITQIVYRAKDEDVDNPIEAVLTICDKIQRFQLSKKDRQAISSFIAQKDIDSFAEALEALRNYPEQIKGMQAEAVCRIIERLTNAKTVYEFMKLTGQYLEGLDKDYQKREVDSHYKEPQLFRLQEISKKYGADFRQFYRDIEKARKAGGRSRSVSSTDTEQAYQEIHNTPIHLMTATRSKGHEFDAVIILDADDGEWPARMSNDIEEERRLFYVALSRARKYLCFVISGEKLESRFLLEAGLI